MNIEVEHSIDIIVPYQVEHILYVLVLSSYITLPMNVCMKIKFYVVIWKFFVCLTEQHYVSIFFTRLWSEHTVIPVSYTHLTLPTIYSV